MPRKVHATKLSSTAKAVVRSGTTVTGSTLYTVPAGKTLVITGCWLALVASGVGNGTLQLQAPSEDTGSNQNLLALTVPISTGAAHRMTECEVRVPAAGVISGVGTNLAVANYGFSGYLESA